MGRGNLRDLGGLATASGRVVRSGVLLRSEAPITLDETERRQLDEVTVVFDLRARGEAADASAVWATKGGPEVVYFPLGEQIFNPEVLVEMATDAEYCRHYMAEYYLQILDELRRGCLRELAGRLGERQNLPVFVHCTGGKDRTGLVAAVVLLVLGATREVVISDDVRSAESWDLNRLMGWMRGALDSSTQPMEEAVQYLQARPEYLTETLDFLLAEYGSVEAYWESAGVDRTALERLRSTLLDGTLDDCRASNAPLVD